MKKVNHVNKGLLAMRNMTEVGVPFSFEYLSHDSTREVSGGVKTVKRAVLRTGMSQEMSDKNEILVAYIDLDGNIPRQFYAPLLLKVNDIKLCELKG